MPPSEASRTKDGVLVVEAQAAVPPNWTTAEATVTEELIVPVNAVLELVTLTTLKV